MPGEIKVLYSKPKVIWFTGLPCSGKTTIARKFRSLRVRAEHLDGDIVRNSFCSDLGFTKEDREENIKRVAFVAELLQKNMTIPICSFITPSQNSRDWLRNKFDNFHLIYTKASVETCEQRDVKGMYKKARNGEIENFTGVSDPYEEPENPDLILNTGQETVQKSLDKLIDYLYNGNG